MKQFQRKNGQNRYAGKAARQQLIKREMRFVLQQDEKRFTRQLLARLLDEGCNLNPNVARTMFYEHFEVRLMSAMPPGLRVHLTETLSQAASGFSQPRFNKTVKFFISHLSQADKKITAAVLDVIDTLKHEWQQTAEKCLFGDKPMDSHLMSLIDQFKRHHPEGNLANHGTVVIGRRLRIAITASLLRHVRKPDLLREKFGCAARIVQGSSQNPELFPELMSFFNKHVSYARLVATRTFWRTLNNMDLESTTTNRTEGMR